MYYTGYIASYQSLCQNNCFLYMTYKNPTVESNQIILKIFELMLIIFTQFKKEK